MCMHHVIGQMTCEEVYLHHYQTFEEAAAVLADLSGGRVSCRTSPLIVGLRAS